MSFAAGFKSAYRSALHQAWRYNAAWTTASRAAAAAAGSACAARGGRRSIGDYARAFKTKKQSAHEALRSRLRPQPSILDFGLRFQFRRSAQHPRGPSTQLPWAWGTHRRHGRPQARPYPLDAQGSRAKLRLLLLEAYAGRSLRHTPQSCPAHGRERSTPCIGGVGGGRHRIVFNHAKWRACSSLYRRAHRKRRLNFRGRHGPCPIELATWFTDRQLDRGCRKIQHLNKLAPVTSFHPHGNVHSSNGSGANSTHHTDRPSSQDTPPHSSGFLRPRSFQARPGGTLMAGLPSSTTRSFVNTASIFNIGVSRLFSTSTCKRGPDLLLKAAFLLKSSSALHWINLLFRVSVSFIPLSLKRASWARKARLAQLATGAAVATPYWASVFKIICRGALALPFVLLVAVLLVAIERTPITGRLRLLLLNNDEEQDIVNKVLEIGAMEHVTSEEHGRSTSTARTGQRDWLSIMRTVLGEENAPEDTLLGGKTLAPSDWRTHLVEQVLAKLERGVPSLNFDTTVSSLDIEPPPLSYPLHNSARCSHLQPRNAVLVIDRPESNAFSFGFYGAVNEPQPGVIIVFTGAIDEIMASGMGSEKSKTDVVQQFNQDFEHGSALEPSWLRSFFGSLLSPTPIQNNRSRPATTPMSHEQEEALAVLVAHELAHLVCSHTIESYATTALLWPQLEKLGWDMLRVFIYPVTAILGPFVQDAISATVKVGIEESAEGRGLLPALTSSCESKKLEYEADAVALRLLANAGIDPRSAIQFWEERLFHQDHSSTQLSHDANHHDHSCHLRSEVRQMHEVHCENDAETHSFIKTHPADQERIAAIRKELSKWRIVSKATV